MINDRPHIAFSLATARHLPLTGELHPLRVEFARWLATGNAVTLLLAASVFATWYLTRDLRVVNSAPDGPKDRVVVEFPPPPSIAGPRLDRYRMPSAPKNAYPQPVVSPIDSAATIPDQGELRGDLPGPGDGPADETLVVEDPTPPPPSFQAFDEPPVLVSIDPYEYPKIVRDAGIDGTVEVLVLVGRNGRVKEARAVSGPDPLHAAAVASARTAVFTPALQGTRPVEVWIVIPVTFRLNDR